MKTFLVLSLLLQGVVAWANTESAEVRVCVRNYLQDENVDPCVRFPQAYIYVTPYPGVEKKVCARIYADFYCEGSKTYLKVEPENKTTPICTVNYDQPGLANFCEQLPQFYDYAVGAP